MAGLYLLCLLPAADCSDSLCSVRPGGISLEVGGRISGSCFPRRELANHWSHPAIVRLEDASGPWWGTHVGGGLIVTCAHGLSSGAVTVYTQRGLVGTAAPCSVNRDQDVAVLRLSNSASLPVMGVAQQSVGGPFTVCGRQAQYLGMTEEGDLRFSPRSYPGDSGQPIYRGNTLVSILWGTSSSETIGCHIREVVACLRECREPDRLPPNPPDLPLPDAPTEIDALREEIAELRALIEKLEGIPGPPGRDGADGQQGLPGTVDYSKISPITFQIVGPKGEVLQEVKASPGGLVRLRLTPKE